MFKCRQCSNRYQTRTSLTRHTHNHTQEGQHTCKICHVRFRRHDLLARHEKIHSNLPQQAKNVRSRRRCHTACVVCRTERKRCNGDLPCSTCIVAGETCSYSLDSRRVSQAAPPIVMEDTIDSDVGPVNPDEPVTDINSPGSLLSPAETHEPSPTYLSVYARQTDHCAELRSLQQGQNRFDGVEAPFASNASSMDHEQSSDVLFETQQSGFDHTTQVDGVVADVPQDFIPSPESSFFNEVAWPWTHQSIYFQEGLGMYTSNSGQINDQTNFSRSNRVFISDHIGSSDFVLNDQNSTNNQSRAQQPFPIASDDQANDSFRDIEILQKMAVEHIISHAFDLEQPRFDHLQYWAARSEDIRSAFMLNHESQPARTEQYLLDIYVDLYFKHFHPLWPLFWRHGLEYGQIHPVLYLVLVSIGTMYNGTASQRFGSMLHEQLRNALFMLPLEINLSEKDILDLSCSLLLTQVAALYFEQQHAFSAAQRLGGMLVALAHRLELFKPRRAAPETQPNADAMLTTWITNESRKRLAFGILRAETFVSVLLNTKPLVDYEEINLELPVPDNIWLSHPNRSEFVLDTINQDRQLGKGVLFSDLVRIALDQNETLPLTKATGHELLIFGLQHSVWRFAHDPDLLIRLTGRDGAFEFTYNGFPGASDSVSNRGPNISQQSKRDYLDFTARKMADLQREKWCVLHALGKWKQGLANSQFLASQDGDSRSVYLSSILLYHLSLLRLNAPVSMIQQAAYELNINENFRRETVEKIYCWTRNNSSNVAAENACTIWKLIDSETSRPEAEQARYNILALIGLHQAAVTVWAYASMQETSNISLDITPTADAIQSTEILLCRNNIRPLLANFVKLYPKITPAWGMQSSFSRVALSMSKKPLQSTSLNNQ